MKRCTRRTFRKKILIGNPNNCDKNLSSVVIQNDYTLKYSAAVALMYMTKCSSKTFRKFEMQFKANIYFFGMRNDHNRQANDPFIFTEVLCNTLEKEQHTFNKRKTCALFKTTVYFAAIFKIFFISLYAPTCITSDECHA